MVISWFIWSVLCKQKFWLFLVFSTMIKFLYVFVHLSKHIHGIPWMEMLGFKACKLNTQYSNSWSVHFSQSLPCPPDRATKPCRIWPESITTAISTILSSRHAHGLWAPDTFEFCRSLNILAPLPPLSLRKFPGPRRTHWPWPTPNQSASRLKSFSSGFRDLTSSFHIVYSSQVACTTQCHQCFPDSTRQCSMCFFSVSKGTEPGKQQGQETFVNLPMNDQQDDKHSHLTIVTSHTLVEVTDTVLGKYRWIKILKRVRFSDGDIQESKQLQCRMVSTTDKIWIEWREEQRSNCCGGGSKGFTEMVTCEGHNKAGRQVFKVHGRDFPGGPVVKNLPSNRGDVGSIPSLGTKIPHAMRGN